MRWPFSYAAAAIARRRYGGAAAAWKTRVAAEQASETLRANKTKEGGEGTWAPSLLLLQFCLLLPFFCALPYLPLTYTLAILSIMYYRSFRLGSRARRQALCSVRRSSGSSRQAKNGELLQAGKKSSINTPYSNRNAKTTPSWLELVQCNSGAAGSVLCHHRLARSFDSLTSSIPSY